VRAADFTIRQALGDLRFLHPDAYSPSNDEKDRRSRNATMPPEVWADLVQTLQAEQTRRSNGWRRRPRMLTAVVAAAAVVIAGGVVVQSRQSSEPAPVAAEAPLTVATAGAQPAANGSDQDPGRMAAPREPAGAGLAPELPAIKGNLGPNALGDAQLPAAADTETGDQVAVAPARRVLASGTDYRAETLGDQVEALLAQLGITSQRALEQLPQQAAPLVAGETGFTASEEALTGCLVTLRGPITAISHQAYLVDRARFAGQDIGLILLPAGTTTEPESPMAPMMVPEPSATLGTNAGLVDIWIVTPACGPLGATAVHHVLHQLTFP
jgi:hypothetical protein